MKLISLTLNQFKGVDAFTLNLDGNSATVSGENGAGKSTLADAYLWLLAGKNSAGETFDPFPVDETGKRKHQGQEPTVEAEFIKDDEEKFTLKRALVEKWTKKRGHAESDYTGDETKCWIDKVPNSITEFNSFIQREFAEDSVLRLLTNTGYFNQQIKKDERRALLFKTFGDMADAEILQATLELAELAAEIGRKSVDEYQRMIKAQYTETCNQLDLLPVRIDEAAKSLADGIDADAAKDAISKINVELATLRYELANDRGNPATAAKDKIRELTRQIESEQSDWKQAVYVASQEYNRENLLKFDEAENRLRIAGINLDNIKNDMQRGEKRVTELNADIQSKRDAWSMKKQEWDNKNAEVFLPESDNCPTCGQIFSPEMLEEMQANWNERKAEHLAQISTYMSQVQESGKSLAAELEKCNAALAGLKEKREQAQRDYDEAAQKLQEFEKAHKPYEPDLTAAEEHAAKINGLKAQIIALESQLAAADNGENPEKEKMQQRVVELETQLSEQQEIVAKAKMSDEAQRRIDEYGKQQKELGTVRDHAEKMLYLCDQFIRIKSEKITDNINRHFKIVRFSLFEIQKNGGLKQICEANIDGVSYDQLNRARKVAASLDIVSTFSKALGVNFPLFVDDSEGIFETYGVTLDAQQIKLIATEDGEGLRAELCI